MVIFTSEKDFFEVIEKHNQLVFQCVSGMISFSDFCEIYNNFYVFYALDGHESDEEEQAIFQKYDYLIEPHRLITYEILSKLCADEDEECEIYRMAGFFGSNEALKRLANIKNIIFVNSIKNKIK
jgi:hypothetical protein